MKNILIINLKRIGDLIGMASTIASVRTKHPKAQISLLVFSEFQKAASIINGIDQIHTLNRKEIESYYKNKIYSDAFSFEKFSNDIDQIRSKNWDIIVNYSNDKTAAYITSFLSTNHSCSFRGLKFDHHKTVKYSSLWAIVLNDITSSKGMGPIHFTDVYHGLCEVEPTKVNNYIKIKEKYTKKAFQSFQEIRSQKPNLNTKIIGIQLKTSSEQKDIPLVKTIDFIEYLTESTNYIPVMLIAPLESERNIAHEINKKLSHKVIVIEADLAALPSVLSNLDAVVTPDTFIKHLCDLQDLPILEISEGNTPTFKQSTTNPNSLLFLPLNDKYTANEMIAALNLIFSNKSETSSIKNASLYRPFIDKLGINYSHVTGYFPLTIEFSRLFQRNYLAKKLTGFFISDIFSSITTSQRNKELALLVNEEKRALTDASKELLATIRQLIAYKENEKRSQEFITSLGKLLEVCNSKYSVSIPAKIFQAHLESVPHTNMTDNLRKMETLLMELKADFQLIMENLQIIENESRNQAYNRSVSSNI